MERSGLGPLLCCVFSIFSLGFMFFPYGFPSEFRATLFFLFLNFGDFGKLFRAIVEIVLASPGPGVAGNGFSAKKDGQFRGRGSDPCPGDPIRGHFPFLDKRSFSLGFPSFLLGPRRPQEVL